MSKINSIIKVFLKSDYETRLTIISILLCVSAIILLSSGFFDNEIKQLIKAFK